MDDTLRNPAAGRQQTTDDSGDHQTTTAPAGEAGTCVDPKPTTETVTVCGWCPELHILKLNRRENDVVIITQQGKELRVWRNGKVLVVSHGICKECERKVL